MTTTTRIPKTELTGICGALMKRMSKKRLGEVPSPLSVCWHNRPVLKGYFAMTAKAAKWEACGRGICLPAPGRGHRAGFIGARRPETSNTRCSTGHAVANGAPALRIDDAGALDTVVSLAIEDSRVTRIYAFRNPDKLAHIEEAAPVSR